MEVDIYGDDDSAPTPGANKANLYVLDVGAVRTLRVKLSDGAVCVVATVREPAPAPETPPPSP